MDLGALICTPRLPACGRCPVAGCCRAHRMGRAGELPVRKKKKALPRRREVVLVVVQHGRLLLRKRPYGGMLGGLWEFPSLVPEKKEYPEEAAARLLAEIDAAGTLQPLGESRHTYSHFHLESKIFYDAAETKNSKVRENEQAWFSPAEMADVPVHGAHKKIFALVQKTGTPDFGWSEKEMDEIV
jgi:A/G-specific adenine glycosylase